MNGEGFNLLDLPRDLHQGSVQFHPCLLAFLLAALITVSIWCMIPERRP